MPDILALKLSFRDPGAFQEGLERQLCCHRKKMISWLPECIGCGRVLVEDPRRIEIAEGYSRDDLVGVDGQWSALGDLNGG
ncbi:hypothetical protein D3C87_1831030 [compost metagenome]